MATDVTESLREEDRRFIEEAHQMRLNALRAEIAIGIGELDRGEGREWSVEEIKAEGQARLAARNSF